MNELVFFLQIAVLIVFALGAKRLGAGTLTAWVCVQALVANLFVLKQITLFGLEVTASDSYAIGSLLGLNFLQEHFGREEAQKATKACFFLMLFFAIVSQLHLLYVPSLHDETQAAFTTLLSPSPRLFAASLAVFWIVQQIDIRLFVFLKAKLPLASFAVRAGIALIISQFLDTFLFSFAGLYGLVASVAEIIVLSFFIKMIVVACCTTILKMAKT